MQMFRNNAALTSVLSYYYAQPGFGLILLQGADQLTPQATLKDFLQREVAVDGYNRRPIVFGSAAANESLQAIEFAEQSITFTAGPIFPIQFDGFVVIRGGPAVPRIAVTTIALNSPAVFSFGGDPGVSGQEGIFTSAGTLPTGIVSGSIYKIGAVNGFADNFTASFTGPTNAPVILSDTGIGSLKWVPLTGELAMPFDQRPADGNGNRTYTIQPNQSHIVRVKLGIKVAA
jgi:hypothetical protein